MVPTNLPHAHCSYNQLSYGWLFSFLRIFSDLRTYLIIITYIISPNYTALKLNSYGNFNIHFSPKYERGVQNMFAREGV